MDSENSGAMGSQLHQPNCRQDEVSPRALLTPCEVRSALRSRGMTIGKWAVQHGFSPALVYVVMRGKRKCLRGESYRIAVALGMKAPPDVQPPFKPGRKPKREAPMAL